MASISSRAKTAARSGLKVVAAASDRLSPPAPGVVILLYHQVGAPRPGAVNLPVGLFEEQMAWLAARGAVCSLDDALDAVNRSTAPSVDPVVITFDDGTADFAEQAAPILERHRLPATLYLATEWVESGRSFWDDGTVLSWSALADVAQTGFVTIGSHTHSHVLLDRLAPADIDDELDRSIGLIGDRLGMEARHFAYPKALPPSVAAADAVRRRFASAALAGSKPNPFGATDPFALARTPIQVFDGMRWFTRKAEGGLGLEDRFRARLASRRYAGATR